MDLLPPLASWALPATALLLLSWLALRWRGRHARHPAADREALDTLAAWPPQAVRVLTVAERQAYDLLRRALPGYLVLAQVPLSRFIRVPRRNSYTDWVQRVGLLNVDLLLCDAGSRVLVAIDIRLGDETPGAKRRHASMARVLRETGIPVLTWYDGELPSLTEVRNLLTPLLGAPPPAVVDTPSRPMPLAPVGEDWRRALAAGDATAQRAAAAEEAQEPVPSAFFEDCVAPIARR